MSKNELSQAVLGASGKRGASPIGNFPDIAGLYDSTLALGEATPAAGASAHIASQQAAEAERAAAAARARAAAEKQAKNAIHETKNYEAIRKKDGGFDFFFTDPSGKRQQVDIATMTKNTQTSALDWIKDSQNPIDIQYINDHKNLNDFMDAVTSKDSKRITAYQEKEPNLKQFNDRGGLDRLIQQFKQSYQRYYTPSSWGVAPGQPVVPTPGTSSGSTDIISQLQQLAQQR